MSYEQTLVEGISTLKIFCRLPELKSKGINLTPQLFNIKVIIKSPLIC